MKIFISREVPFGPLHLIARCGGAEVGWEGESTPFTMDDEQVTHCVVDRPVEHLKIVEGREYVQPQWLLDSFNTRVKLPIRDYAPGKIPPPHLSPFVDDVKEGYVPEQREILNQLVEEKKVRDGEDAESDEEASDAEVEDEFMKELEAERAGVWHSDYAQQMEDKRVKDAAAAVEGTDGLVDPEVAKAPTKKLTRKERDAKELKEQQKMMMKKKHKRLLHRIETSKADKNESLKALAQKRSDIKKKEKA